MLATAISVGTGAYLLVCLWVVAGRKPGYRHIEHTISELGEVGAPDQHLVALGVFLPVGVLLLIVAWLVQSTARPAALLALCIAIGYLGAAAFPCDRGAPLQGTWRQHLHNVAGGIEYVGGGLALIWLADWHGRAFKILGLAVLAATLALSSNAVRAMRGVIQRVAELCLLVGLAWAVWRASS